MERKRRNDRGPRVTDRDLDALQWIAQQYAVSFDHLSILLARLINPDEYAQKPKEAGELTTKRTAKIVKRWETLGLVEREWILHGDPPWIWLTPEGLRTVAQELGELRPYTPTPAKVNHLYWCNHARLYVEQHFDTIQWLSERQVRASRKSEQGVKQPHIPDALVSNNGHDIALEVELSTKTYPRLEKILQEFAEGDYHSIWYFTLGRAKQVVETALDAMQDIDKSRFAVYDVEKTELE